MAEVIGLKPEAEAQFYIDRKSVLAAIPTNWLDSMLTGPRAAIPGQYGKFDCRDIENLLKAVHARLEGLPTMEPCECCHALCDSRGDGCSNCS